MSPTPDAVTVPRRAHEPLTLQRLATLLTDAAEPYRWRLIAEFLQEYCREPPRHRHQQLHAEPAGTGDEHWDVFLAALAEHLTTGDGHHAATWTEQRILRRFWFPFNTPTARADAIVHAPTAFRRRGIYVAAQELTVAATATRAGPETSFK